MFLFKAISVLEKKKTQILIESEETNNESNNQMNHKDNVHKIKYDAWLYLCNDFLEKIHFILDSKIIKSKNFKMKKKLYDIKEEFSNPMIETMNRVYTKFKEMQKSECEEYTFQHPIELVFEKIILEVS